MKKIGSSNKLSRNANERLLKIHQVIAAQRFPNTFSLARDLEISRKTLKRDIQWMKDHWDLPIAFNRCRKGFYYEKPVDKFPGVPTVTEAEMFALLVAHKSIEQYQSTPFHKPLQMAFQRLTGQLDRGLRYSLHDFESVLSFRPFAPEVTDMERFESVTRALRHHRIIRFEYRKPGEKASALRCVQPYHLTCNENLWYLIGYDEGREDFRTFVLSRICGPIFVGDKFEPDRSFDLNEYLSGSFTMLKGEGDYEVVIEFDPWATDMLRHRLWHQSQQIKELPGGGSHLRMRLSALEEIERWVLSWGTHATVIKPEMLAERVGKIAAKLVNRYADATTNGPESTRI
jgi:predicted DNA-binding transcriptional regulator YafY